MLQQPADSSEKHTRARWFAAVQLAMIPAALWVVALNNPETSSMSPPCLFFKTTGFHCPGCGSTRATHQLLNGRLQRAFRYNPLAMLIGLPLVVYYLASLVKQTVTGRPLAFVLRWPPLIWFVAILLVVFGVVRNLPFGVFDLLRPPGGG